METMKKSWDDVLRIIVEENEKMEGRDPEEVVSRWFAEHDFDGELIQHVQGGFGAVVKHVIGNYLENHGTGEGFQQLPQEVFMAAVVSIGLGMFTLGYLVKEQLGAGEFELPSA